MMSRCCTCRQSTHCGTGVIAFPCCEIAVLGQWFLATTTSVRSSIRRRRYHCTNDHWGYGRLWILGRARMSTYEKIIWIGWPRPTLVSVNLISTHRTSGETEPALIFYIYVTHKHGSPWKFYDNLSKHRVVICSNDSGACLLRLGWGNMCSCWKKISLSISWRVGTY